MKNFLLSFVRNYFPSVFLFLKYFTLKTKPSDINEHLKTLYKYSKDCQSIFETGVRGVVSSWALLYGLSKNNSTTKKILLNDIEKVNVESISKIAKKKNIDLHFIQKNNLELEINSEFNFDLTFIDTLHVYGQLKRELEKFSPVTKKYIILHDTTVDGEFGEVNRLNFDINEIYKETKISKDELLIGLWPAVEEFVANNKNWIIKKRYTNNNGLTVLKRIN